MTGFALRAPWYVRERGHFDLRDTRALVPTIQMYDSTEFVRTAVKDPGDSLEFGTDDLWSYPVSVTPGGAGSGLRRFVAFELMHTHLRKLYQPAHDRFYLVVVEVFCDEPGLPRAGSHRDFTVDMIMRRRHGVLAGPHTAMRKLARNLVAELGATQHPDAELGPPDIDAADLLFADLEHRDAFVADNAELVQQLRMQVHEQAWITGKTPGWRSVVDDPVQGALPQPDEELLPMFRLPPREGCPPDETRSLWACMVPTFSAQHWTDDAGLVQTKLDDQEIYQIRCVVTQPPPPGKEHCPPQRHVSAPTRPFRLADPFDPDGTKNRTVSIKAPDLRRLAARAGRPQGPGGVRITTPPGSGLKPIDFSSIPTPGKGETNGGSICTFALELFFIVAFFLFLLFLPIVVLMFQLWWMLALRFCLPPTGSFQLLAAFVASNPGGGPAGMNPDESRALDELLGLGDAKTHLVAPGSALVGHLDVFDDITDTLDPGHAVVTPTVPPHLHLPPDPLCPAPP